MSFFPSFKFIYALISFTNLLGICGPQTKTPGSKYGSYITTITIEN